MHSTLQRKLLSYFLLLSLLPSILFLSCYLYLTQRQLKQQMHSERQMMLEHTVEKLENRVTQVNEFISWTLGNETIQGLLQQSEEQAAEYREENHKAAQILKEQFSYRPITQNMLSFIILGENGIDLRAGTEGYLIDAAQLKHIFRRYDEDLHWIGMIDNPTALTENPQVIGYIREIADENSGKRLGNLLILFSTDFVADEVSSILSLDSNRVSLHNAEGITLYQSSDIYQDEGKTDIISVEMLSTGWVLQQTVQGSMITSQLRSLIGSMCLLVAVIALLTAFLSVFLSRNISVPIERLTAHIRRLSGGDFSHRGTSQQSSSEIDELDHRLQNMGDNIQLLMRQQEEKQKLELRLLQSQMKPHFLYNTLNSIRMMAVLQGKNSISEMIEALGRLLRANLAGSEELILMSEELRLLESYLFIQNMRLKGKIHFTAEIPEELMCTPVLKFILQPLAENAILHGIGNQPLGGRITLRASCEQEVLLLTLQDNGCGMTADASEALRKKLKDVQNTVDMKTAGTHGMALRNVQARIQLRWGREYGLTFQTEEGKGTQMEIRMPLLSSGKEKI